MPCACECVCSHVCDEAKENSRLCGSVCCSCNGPVHPIAMLHNFHRQLKPGREADGSCVCVCVIVCIMYMAHRVLAAVCALTTCWIFNVPKCARYHSEYPVLDLCITYTTQMCIIYKMYSMVFVLMPGEPFMHPYFGACVWPHFSTLGHNSPISICVWPFKFPAWGVRMHAGRCIQFMARLSGHDSAVCAAWEFCPEQRPLHRRWWFLFECQRRQGGKIQAKWPVSAEQSPQMSCRVSEIYGRLLQFYFISGQ